MNKLPADNFLIEKDKAPQEVIVDLLVPQGLADLIEEGELVEGAVLAGLGHAHVAQNSHFLLLGRRMSDAARRSLPAQILA